MASSIAAFVFGTWLLGELIGIIWGPPTEATCDGHQMGPYDKCALQTAGGTSINSSDTASQLASERFGHFLWLYIIAFVLMVAIVSFTAVAYSRFLGRKMGGRQSGEIR